MEIPAITFPLLGDDFILNFSPFFTIFGWKIYWYGVIIAVGFLLAVLYTTKRAPTFGLTEDDMIDTFIWAVPLGIICARLYYVIFYRDSEGLNPYFDGVDDFKDIIRIWNGGLAIYGGVIGGVIGLVIATRMKKISTRAVADVSGFGLLIGQAIGRWGNFTNREAFGGATTLPWRMGFKYSYGTYYHHPTFLYESLWNVIGFLILHFWSKKHRKFDGEMFLCYLAWYGLGRVWIEGLRTDSLYLGSSNLRVSQFLAGLTFLVSLGILLYVRFFRHPEAEELWVNRDKREAILAAERLEKEEREAAAEKENFDEELSDAFRILNAGADPEGMTEAPVVEQVEVKDISGEAEAEPAADSSAEQAEHEE